MWINNKDFKINRYSSQEMKLKKQELLELVENNSVNIIYNGEISLFELIIIIKFFESNNIQVELTLSYLPYQRMDKNNDIEVKTIDMVANIFNSLNLKKLYICEPHCQIDIFNNAHKIDLVKKIFEKVKLELNFKDEEYICFVDKGSRQKYGNLGKNHIHFEKTRSLQTGLINKHTLVGSFNGKRLILVDDIISSGDTIISCLNLLPKEIDVYIICGHLENNIYNKRLFDCKQVKKIYSSNSLTKNSHKKLKLFDIKELIDD